MSSADASYTERRRAFRLLHESGCFVIPNPWDAGSARVLQQLGFKALATTSAGCAWSNGRPDGAAGLEATLANVRAIVGATDLPVNADFESGFAATPEGVAANVAACVAAGVAGLSIEDSTGRPAEPLYPLPVAVERLRAARTAIDATQTGVLLAGRAECYLVGHPDPLGESLRRLTAYAEAGADVLFAPGVATRDDIAAIVAAVAPRPVNVVVSRNIGLTVADLAALGVRRISVGGALARAAWTAFARAAQTIADDGVFTGFDDILGSAAIHEYLHR
ncbi:MAG TPA: isocitrate lyase/phosphoenolpyruvate mutase family protein [Vicinamibacterales bacterium]|nr:isocitrate lyase/phosphoenolpyruvate mutase family protein [Vicinamibacterales bacterium]